MVLVLELDSAGKLLIVGYGPGFASLAEKFPRTTGRTELKGGGDGHCDGFGWNWSRLLATLPEWRLIISSRRHWD
jgi:hypothetical protein